MFENFGNGDIVFLQISMIVGDVIASWRMAPVGAGHEATSRRCANTTAGICLSKAKALFGELVDVGGLDLLLPVAAQVSVAEIIGHDEDDVGEFC